MSDQYEIFTQFFLDPEVILSSHTMFIIVKPKQAGTCGRSMKHH